MPTPTKSHLLIVPLKLPHPLSNIQLPLRFKNRPRVVSQREQSCLQMMAEPRSKISEVSSVVHIQRSAKGSNKTSLPLPLQLPQGLLDYTAHMAEHSSFFLLRAPLKISNFLSHLYMGSSTTQKWGMCYLQNQVDTLNVTLLS